MASPLFAVNGQTGITQLATAQTREPNVAQPGQATSRQQGDTLSISEDARAAAIGSGRRVPLEVVRQVPPTVDSPETTNQRAGDADPRQGIAREITAQNRLAANAPTVEDLTRSVRFGFDDQGNIRPEVVQGTRNETVVRRVPPASRQLSQTPPTEQEQELSAPQAFTPPGSGETEEAANPAGQLSVTPEAADAAEADAAKAAESPAPKTQPVGGSNPANVAAARAQTQQVTAVDAASVGETLDVTA